MSDEHLTDEQRRLKILGDATWERPLIALRRLSDDQLVELHDALVHSRMSRHVADTGYYRDELRGRQLDRQADASHRLTIANTILAAAASVAAIIALFT